MAAAVPVVLAASSAEASEALAVAFPAAMSWEGDAKVLRYLKLPTEVAEALEPRVLEAFSQHRCGWSDFDSIHVDLLREGSDWGHEGNCPKPYMKGEVLEKGYRLKELVSRAVTLAANQVDAPFRADRIDFIARARAEAPNFGPDATAEMSYVRRIHRVALTKYHAANVVPPPDELRLIFKRKA